MLFEVAVVNLLLPLYLKLNVNVRKADEREEANWVD